MDAMVRMDTYCSKLFIYSWTCRVRRYSGDASHSQRGDARAGRIRLSLGCEVKNRNLVLSIRSTRCWVLSYNHSGSKGSVAARAQWQQGLFHPDLLILRTIGEDGLIAFGSGVLPLAAGAAVFGSIRFIFFGGRSNGWRSRSCDTGMSSSSSSGAAKSPTLKATVTSALHFSVAAIFSSMLI